MKKENKIMRQLDAIKLDFSQKDSYSGEILVDSNRYRFRVGLTEPEKNDYLVRGQVTLIDIDGHVLQLTGSESNAVEEKLQKEGKTLSKHDARSSVKRSVYCRSTDPAVIKQKILDAVEHLEEKHGMQVHVNAARERDVGSMNLKE